VSDRFCLRTPAVSPCSSLPFRIYYLAAEHRNAGELEQGFGATLVLLCLTGMLFLAAFFVQRRIADRVFVLKEGELVQEMAGRQMADADAFRQLMEAAF